MILVDTTPLVALCDPRDALHLRAIEDLDKLARQPLVVCAPVLAEACFLLERPIQRERLERILTALSVRPFVTDDEASLWREIFQWLQRYAEHEPDWADAYLVVASEREKGTKVWTYDSEFRTTWRRLSGSRIPMATRGA